ncbi:MAG: hypothetical protein GF329_14050 [Candidatus Lokiarchaeota archaeon]|nr:hypothetical protein [Candidatus Lokiarchaeota archaeon]
MLKKFPLLINNRPEMKTTFDEYKVLYHCDGETDIGKISERTGLSILEILLTVNKYIRKGKIRLKYSIDIGKEQLESV